MPDREQQKSKSLLHALLASRLARFGTLAGGPGLEGTTLGAMMVGAVTGAYYFGAWLDHRFGTTFWMPVMVMLGAGAGLFEMIRTALRIGKRSGRAVSRPVTEAEPVGWQEKADESAAMAPPPRSSRGVPPPPEPSFSKAGQKEASGQEPDEPRFDALLKQVEELKRMKDSLDDNTIRRND